MKYIIKVDAGYGNHYEEVEAKDRQEALELAYEAWLEEADNNLSGDFNSLLTGFINAKVNELTEHQVNRMAQTNHERITKLTEENAKLQNEVDRLKAWVRKMTKLREAVEEFQGSL